MTHDRENVRRRLEHDLIERSDEPDLRLIWADLLQLDGDPLGKLVVLDHVVETAPAELSKRARAEATKLRKRLQPRLWDKAIPDYRGVTLIWRQGFVRELHICAEQLPWPSDSTPITLLSDLLRQAALRWVEVVRIDDDNDRAPWLDRLFRRRMLNPILREIHIGRPPESRTRPTGPWEPHGAPVGSSTIAHVHIQGLRQLRELSIGGERRRLPCRDGNPQTRLHHVVGLATRQLTLENRVSLARALWDPSELVLRAAFETAKSLGPRAAFLLDELAWFLRPPLSKNDPRPLATLQTLTAIGPASASLLGEVLARPHELLNRHRIMAFMNWLTALGPAAAAARPLLDSLLHGSESVILKDARQSIAHALRAIETAK